MIVKESIVSHRPKSNDVECILWAEKNANIPIDLAFVAYERFFCRQEGLIERAGQLKKRLEEMGWSVYDEEGVAFNLLSSWDSIRTTKKEGGQ